MNARLLIHTLGIAAAAAGIMLATLLPFLPGDYDSLAETLSAMARVFGVVGLLLVPVGALWVASEYWSRLAGKQYGIAIAALIVPSIVWILGSLMMLVVGSLTLGVGMLVFWIYAVSRAWAALKRLKKAGPRPPSAVAFYLLIVPVAVLILQILLVGRAIESSRNRAIRNSAQLIADIERYRAAQGRYPASLLAVWADYKTGVIGIKEYVYEPSGDAYNLVFEQIALAVGTREFVVYNPRDEQVMTSHANDLLTRTHELTWRRGYYAVNHASHPHWKYFWFD